MLNKSDRVEAFSSTGSNILQQSVLKFWEIGSDYFDGGAGGGGGGGGQCPVLLS